MPITPETTVTRNDDLMIAEIDGEVVLMHVDKGNYYGLDQIGSDIWERMAGPVSVVDLHAALVADYEGDAEEIRADLMELLERMAEHDLVRVAA
ncbi:PqqD family peptide modification chaperone [Tistrella mobilis]|uniref:PqqD family peptide modification chaperone n=1 Tax=Tistrella mobilis TaxID=171437 RepID=UPI003558733C